ncbi:MAG TPA: TrmH family RNA methyltransferase [Salinimicrobium sp.]|nr:TrmH family RNA methyltransferase [Salinimicrobium sp.]
MSSQLSHHSAKFKKGKFPVVLIADGVNGPANIGSLFRISDAFNIEKLILCGPETDLSSPRLIKTARGTLKNVPFEQQKNTFQVCEEYSKEGYILLALEITESSASLDSFSFDEYTKIALIIGNENFGIDKEILKLVQNSIHINMFGENSSMNVAQSAGIALYEITKCMSLSRNNNIFTL